MTERRAAHRLFSSLRLVSLLTFLSRLLGLIRDIGMAALFGNGPVMDAFSVAFRIPNLARRFFGEGALTAAFLPIFVRELEHSGQESAWRLSTAVLHRLALVLTGLVIAGELLLWGAGLFWPPGSEVRLLIDLTAVMLPYLLLICLSAQMGAVLQAMGHFGWPALLPVLLNGVWIASLWLIAPFWSSPEERVTVIAVSIVLAGVLQLMAPLPKLRQFGFRFRRPDNRARAQVREVIHAMLPVLLGLSITQFNAVADSLIAWLFAKPGDASGASLLFGRFEYPLESGTASALYFGQRMYQFPLGVFGIALGTVLFPLFSRHAKRNRLDLLRHDFLLGLRLVMFVGLPAGAGLMLLAEPLTVLLFQRGAFGANDVRQTAGMIVAYGSGVWAFCGLLIVNRAFYAADDRQTPLRVGMAAAVLNLGLNLTLIWIWGGPGLAWATSIAAMIQVVVLAWRIESLIGRPDWASLWRALFKMTLATLGMALICLAVLEFLPAGESFGFRILRVVLPTCAALIGYALLTEILGLDELRSLLRGTAAPTGNEDRDESDNSPAA